MNQNLITEQRVMEELKKAIGETLKVDEDAIKPESSLIRDLGAESLDFLDINYRLEQAFGIKLARHFVLEHIEDMFGEGSAIDENGRLTDKAIELLKIRFGDQMPDLAPGMDMDEVPGLITVQSIARGVLDILNTLPEKCPKCNSSDWKSDDGAHIVCGSCEEHAPFMNGDELTKKWLADVQEKNKIFPES
jgi:acyl carrier protein